MNLLLIGYRGSGKTTVGKILATRLAMGFRDSDEEIVRRAGMDIASIFAQHSEAKFRDLESEVLADLLKHDNQIISLGGGVVVRPQNRVAIQTAKNTKTFFLNCDPHILHQRIAADKKTAAHRPALTSFAGAIAEVEHLLQQRLPWYREVMDFEIDGSQLAPEQIASRIIELCQPSDRADKRA